MKIYTKTGDNGATSLVGGSRVAKDDPRLEAYGTVDELNSFIGLLSDTDGVSDPLKTELKHIQNTLFNLGSQLASLPEDIEKYRIPVVTQADIEAVFQMTPYYYRTRPADKERLANLDTLQTDIDFIIAEYRHS